MVQYLKTMKHKMNFGLLFVVLISTGTLTSCGNSNEEEDDIHININGGNGDSGTDNLKTNPTDLIGTWEHTITFTHQNPAPDAQERMVNTLIFNSDGKTIVSKVTEYFFGIEPSTVSSYGEYTYDGIEEMMIVTMTTYIGDEQEDAYTTTTQIPVSIRDSTLYYAGTPFTRVK